MAPRRLVDCLPPCALNSFEFRSRMVATDTSLVWSRCMDGAEWEEYFRDRLWYKLELLRGMPLVPSAFRFDSWCYRTPEEARVGVRLYELGHRVPYWAGIAVYHPSAVLWSLPRLPAEYRTFKKATDSFWSDTVRMERRVRSRYGILAQWHQPEAEQINMSEQVNRWVVLPQWFREWEVPQGFWAELGPPLAYVGSEMLRDRMSGW